MQFTLSFALIRSAIVAIRGSCSRIQMLALSFSKVFIIFVKIVFNNYCNNNIIVMLRLNKIDLLLLLLFFSFQLHKTDQKTTQDKCFILGKHCLLYYGQSALLFSLDYI